MVVPSSECEAPVALGDEGYEHSVAEEVEAPVAFAGRDMQRKIQARMQKERRARALTREGCKALMTVRRRDCGRWYVAKTREEP
ncbi:hypothetical protein GBA52_028623 [Prunus armeniaca]|nr:hypothetical protein GBA52_028623 [Prunus armeniaca]